MAMRSTLLNILYRVFKDGVDSVKSYNLYANCFITKPVELAQFLTIVKSIEDRWLTIVKLPNADFRNAQHDKNIVS
jgi:hypothetical protein